MRAPNVIKADARLFDREWRLQNLYKIRDENRRLVKLDFDKFPIQRKLFDYAKKKRFRGLRPLIPKGRKTGVSTFWLIFYLDDTIFNENTTSGIIAHHHKDVKKLFNIVKLGYRTCPDQIELSNGKTWTKPKANTESVDELRFDDLNSAIYVGIESRGETNNNLHISEAAFIQDEDRIKATLGSVPNITFGSNISVESTADGAGGWFYEQVMAALTGESNFTLFFFPWFSVPKHAIPCLDWKPGEKELKMRADVLRKVGVLLSDNQLYWWNRTKLDQGRLMDQEFPTFLEDAFLVAGSLAFEEEFLRFIKVKEPIRKHRVEIERVYVDDSGVEVVKNVGKAFYEVTIFAEPRPNRRYVLGGDPSEGVNKDNSVLEVYDCTTLEQVAEFVNNSIPPKEFARVVDKVGRMYNMALAAIELNNHGHAVLGELKLLYSNIYKREYFDEKTNKKTKKLGFTTDSHTRDLILDDFEDLIRRCSVKINSAILLSELFTFIVNKDGKREAKSGTHDDTVMASAIALKVARLPRSTFVIASVP